MTAPSPPTKHELTSSKVLVKNTLWNLIGQALPLAVALLTIPLLIRGLGIERFGILTLAWTLISYFSLFDFGISRALTQFIAEKLAAGSREDTSSIVRTSLCLLFLLGAVGGLVMLMAAPWLVNHVLTAQNTPQREVLISLALLSISVPFIISTAGLCGVLSAYQRFDLINAVRIPASIITFCGPALVLLFSGSLIFIITFLVFEQIIVCLVYCILGLRVMPALRKGGWLPGRGIIPLLKFGTWMTISNIVGPIMVYMDRFFIGAIISLSAVAYYVTPYEVVTKLWIIPGSLVSVIFPAFASHFLHDRETVKLYYARSIKYIFLVLFPVTLLVICVAHEGLSLWLGTEFADNSTRVLQWLSLGIFINSLAQVPLTLIQGIGRPDVTTKVHLLELPCYLAVLLLLLSRYGIEGAAIAWCLRVTMDATILFMLAHRFLPVPCKDMHRALWIQSAAAFLFAMAALPLSLLHKTFFLITVLFCFIIFAKSAMITSEEKAWIKSTYANLFR